MKLLTNDISDATMKKVNKNLNFRYFNVGYYLLIPILIGIFLGINFDKWLHTKPVFTLIFIILGAASSFYNLFKITKDE